MAINGEPQLQQSPLFELHQALQARMIGFGGWQMPVQYQGITAEHKAVRQQAGMFDISHMGKFALQGAHLREQLQPLVPTDLSLLKAGTAKYSVFLNPAAGIIDDLIFYYQGKEAQGERGLLIVNAATAAQDKAWLLDHLDLAQVNFQDFTRTMALVAVQGPRAVTCLQALVAADLAAIKPYCHFETSLFNQPAFFARTGYTGEDGFEIMAAPEVIQQLWRSLMDQGVTPCGLGARDTLRLEAAMALYGQDIDQSTTPLEAGLGWIVHWDKGDFIGRPQLERQRQEGVQRKLVGLQMQGRNIARHGYPVLSQGEAVGVVTSGTLAPTVGKPIALAFVPTPLSQPGQSLAVEIRDKAYPAVVVQRPFYRRPRTAIA